VLWKPRVGTRTVHRGWKVSGAGVLTGAGGRITWTYVYMLTIFRVRYYCQVFSHQIQFQRSEIYGAAGKKDAAYRCAAEV